MNQALAERLTEAAEHLSEGIPEGTREFQFLEGDVKLDELDLYCVNLMREAAEELSRQTNVEPLCADAQERRSSRVVKLETRTSIDVDLAAYHTDPAGIEGRHPHTWNIRLVFDGQPFRDARLLRKALEVFLEPYQGKDLPWWSGEEIARTVLVLGTADPLGCIVTRPGYRAEAWRR